MYAGTYVHGIFDKEEVALGLVRAVGIRKGIDVSEMEAWFCCIQRNTV